MARKRHSTSPKLDYLFERQIVGEASYRDFWERYRDGDAADRRELVCEYINKAAEDDKHVTGVVAQSKRDALDQAKRIGGCVARRNAKGRFSKRGHFYQAINKSKRK